MPNDSSDAVTSRLSELRHLQDVIESFRAHNVDPTEFAYLKGMLLFKTSECCALTCSVSQTRPGSNSACIFHDAKRGVSQCTGAKG